MKNSLTSSVRLLPLLAAGLIALAGCSDTPPTKFRTTDVTGVEWGQGFELQDHTGATRRLTDYRDKVVILAFGYTYCPDICPTALSTLAEVLRVLGEDADNVKVVFVTVDPDRDTADHLRDYVTWFDPRFIGLRGSEKATAAAADAFHVRFSKQHSDSVAGYVVDHTAGYFVFDTSGHIRLFVQHGETPGNISHDVRQLLAGR